MCESHYIIRGGVAGRERLRLLARAMRTTTLQLFERIGLRSGMKCLDVGCGGGDVAFEIARIVGGEGKVVAVDIDKIKLELASREATAQGLDNIEFRRSEIGVHELEPACDLAYARFLLTHLKDPLGALKRIAKALRPGGILVVEDIDIQGSFCHPDSIAFRRYVELYTQTAKQGGADPDIGPRLPGLLVDAGLAGVQMNVVQPAAIEGDVKLVSPVTMENIADAILAAGLAVKEEVDQIIAELYEVARDTRTVLSLPRVVQAWGYRD